MIFLLFWGFSGCVQWLHQWRLTFLVDLFWQALNLVPPQFTQYMDPWMDLGCWVIKQLWHNLFNPSITLGTYTLSSLPFNWKPRLSCRISLKGYRLKDHMVVTTMINILWVAAELVMIFLFLLWGGGRIKPVWSRAFKTWKSVHQNVVSFYLLSTIKREKIILKSELWRFHHVPWSLAYSLQELKTKNLIVIKYGISRYLLILC